MAATMLLLAIGAFYWRGKVRQLRGDGGDFAPLLRRISAWRIPALVLIVASCVSALLGWGVSVVRTFGTDGCVN